MNAANLITLSRLGVGLLFFGGLTLLPDGEEGWAAQRPLAVVTGSLFGLAALTDVLDGQVARALNQVTKFGRMADPLVDKILVCGAFAWLLHYPILFEFLHPWMVLVILGREFGVQGLRSFLESNGIDFSATAWGKWKMGVQSLAVVGMLAYATLFPGQAWARGAAAAMVWLATALTAASGAAYLARARKLWAGARSAGRERADG